MFSPTLHHYLTKLSYFCMIISTMCNRILSLKSRDSTSAAATVTELCSLPTCWWSQSDYGLRSLIPHVVIIGLYPSLTCSRSAKSRELKICKDISSGAGVRQATIQDKCVSWSHQANFINRKVLLRRISSECFVMNSKRMTQSCRKLLGRTIWSY
jgi:hypothetical protein